MKALISMGEASRRLGVYPDTLRNWEKRGLVHPVRDSAGRRLFNEEQIASLMESRRSQAKTKDCDKHEQSDPNL